MDLGMVFSKFNLRKRFLDRTQFSRKGAVASKMDWRNIPGASAPGTLQHQIYFVHLPYPTPKIPRFAV
jgi:hypothetical protein